MEKINLLFYLIQLVLDAPDQRLPVSVMDKFIENNYTCRRATKYKILLTLFSAPFIKYTPGLEPYVEIKK